MVRRTTVISLMLLIPAIFSCTNDRRITKHGLSAVKDATSDFLSLDEAVSYLEIPGAAAPLAEGLGESPELPVPFRPPYTPVRPAKLFDDLYFVGTTAVGSFIVDSGEGLIMFDTGNGDPDAGIMVEGMRELGLDPSEIKVIFISHEHFDHYGGVQYLKREICPDAKVAMSLVGWNFLQNVPMSGNYIGTRPRSVDIFLEGGMKIKIGKEIVQVVSTPGHSPGCLSFIFPVRDNGEVHMAGLMGGMAVWPTEVETQLYITSVEYFKAVAREAGCDVGLFFHSQERDFVQLRERIPGEPNPLVIGTDAFDTVYLEKYRSRYRQML